MSSILPISNILQIADIGQYLAANDISQGKKLKSGFLAPNLAVQIFNAKTVVRWMYNLNPSNTTLAQTANYLFQLLGGYVAQAQAILNNVAGGLATISNPADVSINVGQSATFSVAVTSSSSYTIAWYRNGVIIPGATALSYTLTNAQLADTGATFFAVATNASGPISSGVATLTVTAVITGFFTYSASTDFYPILLTSSDPFVYGTNYSITHNAPIVITLPNTMPANVYMLAKIPIGESVKTIWNNTALNNGTIPDSAFEAIVQFGGFTYYSSRGQISMDISQSLTLS